MVERDPEARGVEPALRLQSQLSGDPKGGCTPREAGTLQVGKALAPPVTPEVRPRAGASPSLLTTLLDENAAQRHSSCSNRPVARVPAGRGAKAACPEP